MSLSISISENSYKIDYINKNIEKLKKHMNIKNLLNIILIMLVKTFFMKQEQYTIKIKTFKGNLWICY